jgi:hypothetical protein
MSAGSKTYVTRRKHIMSGFNALHVMPAAHRRILRTAEMAGLGRLWNGAPAGSHRPVSLSGENRIRCHAPRLIGLL